MPLLQILFEISSGIGADFWAKTVEDRPSWPKVVSLVIGDENGKKYGVMELVSFESALGEPRLE